MKIGIIGIGLIGGSIAKALKKNMVNVQIVAFDVDENMLINAKEAGVIDEYSLAIDQTFVGSEIIFIGTPVNLTVDYAIKLSEIVDENCIITDVGSTKSNICQKIEKIGNINFIGGHPMTGSEKNTFLASSEILFENAFYILTPLDKTSHKCIEKLKEVINILGAIPMELNYKTHDESVAIVSHIPQLLASTLVNYVKENDDQSEILHTLCAGGFKDTTRIASSDGVLWHAIIMNNKENIINNLTKLMAMMDNLKNILINSDTFSQDLIDFIDNGKKYRNTFSSNKKSVAYTNYFRISVDVPDEPMVIAEIATILGKGNVNIKNIGINNKREANEGILEILFNSDEDRTNAIKLLKFRNFVVTR